MPAYGGNVDEPPAEDKPDGRRFQQRERILSAGNTAYCKRVFGQSADTVLLQEEVERRMDKHHQSVQGFHRSRNSGQRKIIRRGQFIHKGATRSCVNNCSKF